MSKSFSPRPFKELSLKIYLFYLCVCVGVSRSQKKTLGPLKLELQAVVSHLTWWI